MKKLFREKSEKKLFSLYEEGKRAFEAEVSILANHPPAPGQRFGLFEQDIQTFVDDLLALEIDGRKFRTKYLIPWMSASALAENFMWTILANREKKEIVSDIAYVKPTAQHWLNLDRTLKIREVSSPCRSPK